MNCDSIIIVVSLSRIVARISLSGVNIIGIHHRVGISRIICDMVSCFASNVVTKSIVDIGMTLVMMSLSVSRISLISF